MLPHPLTNFEIMKYYENESRFNGVYSRDNLPNKTRDEAYIINLDEYSDIGTHWVSLWVNNNVTYFDSFILIAYSEKNYKIYQSSFAK